MATMQVKGSKTAPQVDLTPMVDLGFLLIAFFMFTTTMSDPTVMAIQMPYQGEEIITDPPLVKESTAMTILLGEGHEVFYYYGIGNDPANVPGLESSGFADEGGIRDAILWKKAYVQDLVAKGALLPDDRMTVIIKASARSTTDDLVNILDEMSINQVPIYTFGDITEEELKMMKYL